MLMAGGGVQDHSSGWEMKGGYAFSNHFFGALEAGFFEGSEYLGNDGKGRRCQVTQQRSDGDQRHSLWQRHGLTGFGDTAFH